MVRLVTLLRSRSCVARLREAVRVEQTGRPWFQVRDVADWEGVVRAVAGGAAHAVAFETDHPTAPRGAELTRHLRRHGHVAWIVYERPSPRLPLQRMVDLARAGVRWALTPEVDDEIPRIRRVLRALLRSASEESLLGGLSPGLTARQLGFLRPFLREAVGCRSVADVARRMGTSHRTLDRRASELGLLPPSQLLCCSRLFKGAVLITHHGASVERAASLSGFSSPTAFRRALRRVSGLGIRELRDLERTEELTEPFAAALRTGGPQLKLPLA